MPAPKLIPLWAVIAISAGMTAVSAGLSYALRPNTKLGENKPNEYMTNIVDTDSFVPVLYGMAVAPILVVFLDASPDDVNELHCVAVFSHGRIEGIETVYFDNMEIVAKKKDGQLDVLDKYEKNVWFYHRPGKPGNIDLPYETCVKTFGRWTSKHTSGMLASIYMIARYKQELFSSIPNVFVKAKGLRVYDPRDGQTKWSNNPVLCILEFLTNKVYGKRADINTEINVNSFIAEANYCDEKINWKVSSPKRIRFRLLEKDDNPLEAGTYYIKYSYCYGSTITSEDQAYTFNESIISTAASVTVTSSYGEVLVDGLGVPAEDSGITLKRIYMSTSAGGTYYLIKELDPDITTFRFTTGELGAAYNGNGVPTAPTTVPTVTYTDFSNSGLQKNRKYKYKQTFVKNPGVGETETVPSPASQVAKTTNNAYAVRLKTPDTADEEVTHVRWYRTEGYTSGNKINSDYKKLADVAIATKDYLDKIADGSLGATNPPSSSTLFSKVRRFKCDGVLDTGADQDENLEKLLTSCRGRLYNEGGKYRIFIPKITIPESFELNEDNIIGGWNFRILGMNDRPNVVKASYINPEAEWKSDTVLWPKKDADNFYLKDDNDFKKVMDIDLPFTIDRRIAKTICQVIRKESRNNIVAELTAKEEARKLTGGCLVNVTHSTPGWDKKKFWVDGVGIYPNATVRLILVEYNEDDYNYETLEDETLPGADTDLGDPLDPPDEVANVQFSEESYTNKGVRSWRLKVTFDTPTDTFWDYSEVYVKYGSSNYELYKAVTKESDGVFYIHPIQEFTNYYIKILSISTLGISQHIDDVTEWSHTTGNVTNPPDVSNIGATVRGDTVTLSWAYLTDITDFDYFEIREGSDWDTSILISKTKSTSLVLVGVSGGTHTYRIKAVDTAGNYSANDAYTSPAAFVETSASWTDRITTDFTGGTHIGTEAATVGGLKSVRAKQYITNYSFETDTTGWTLGSGWGRSTNQAKVGTYSLMHPAGAAISNTNKTDSEIEATTGRTYVFASWVWCDKPNAARLAMRIDDSGEVYSNYHPGDSTWKLLSVVQTVASPYASKFVGFRKSVSSATAYFDYCGYSMLYAEYISSSYDRSTSKVQKCLLKFTSYISNPSSSIVIDAGISNDDSSYSWNPGLEVSEVITTGRYSKFRINFINVLPHQYNRIMEDTGGLVHYQEAIPSDPVDIQVPMLGAEKVTNGSFTGSATGWTLGSGWAYGTNNVTKNADGVGTLSQNVSAVVGEIYEVVYTVSAWTAGDFIVSLGGSSVGRVRRQASFMPDDVSTGYGNGTHKDVIVAQTTGDLIFQPTNNARFTIDNVSVKKVGTKTSQTTKVWTSDFDTSDARLNIMSELTDDVMSLGGGRISSRKSVNGWTGDQILIDTEGYCSQDGTANSGANGSITHKYEAIKVAASGSVTMRAGAFGVRLKAVGTLTYNMGTISVENGSYIITGSGTSWPTDGSWDGGQQMIFRTGDSVGYAIFQVNSATEIQLYEFYRGDDSSGDNYEIRSVATSLTEGVNLYLYTDNAGVPGSVISDEITLVPFGLLGTSYVEYIGLVTNTFQLQNGTNYWIVIERYLDPGNGVVCYHEMKAQGTNAHAYSADGSSWTTENNKQGWYRFYAYYGSNIKSVSQYSTAITGYGWAHPGGYFYSELSAALQGESRGKDAVQGLSVYGIGVYGKSIYGKAIEGYTEKGTTAKFRRKINYSGVSTIMQITRGGGGGSKTGYGGRINFELQDAGGTDYTAAGITAIFTKTGSGVSSGQLVFELMKDGSEEREKVWFDDFAHIFGGRKIATHNSVSVTNANKNVLSKTGIHTSVSVGDMALVCQGTNSITTPPPVYRVVAVGTDSITLDRDCRTTGSDATDFSVQLFKDVIALCATDNTNGNMITCFSHQNKPLQLGGNTLASTSGLGFSGEDVTLAGVLNVDVSAQRTGVGNTIGDATLSVKTFGQNAVVNMYCVGASVDYGVIQVSSSGGLTNPSNRHLVLQPNAGGVGIAKIDPSTIVEINLGSSPSAVRLSYNAASGTATYYTDLKTNSSGNFSIKPNGGKVVIGLNNPDLTNNGLHINGQVLRIETSKTPSSTSDAGRAGEICWDSQYIYVCIATNSWAKVPILTW